MPHRRQVYILSARARCSQLAVDLTIQVQLGADFEPPQRPPIAPTLHTPPPPPSPPRPGVPRTETIVENGQTVVVQVASRLRYVTPLRATLSTFFLAEASAEASAEAGASALGNAMGLTMPETTHATVLLNLVADGGTWAQCAPVSGSVPTTPLPCRTGDAPARCVDGARPCAAAADNLRDPSVEFETPAFPDGAALLFIEFALPTEQEYGKLLFDGIEAVDDVVSRGYELVLRDAHHVPLRTQCVPWTSQRVQSHSEGLQHVQHRCADVFATDEDYATLSTVRFVTLTLPGERRMIWFESVTFVLRTLDEFSPSPPAPASPPPLAPQPATPPYSPDPSPPPLLSTLDFFARRAVPDTVLIAEALVEPCGQTSPQCAQHLRERRDTDPEFHFYDLGPSGCCVLLRAHNATADVLTALRTAPETRGGVSGVGHIA